MFHKLSGAALDSDYGNAVLIRRVHAVMETPTYLSDAKAAGVSDTEREHIANAISNSPLCGALIKGTGRARKVRIEGKGKGKRGAYRVITFYAAGACARPERR